MKNPTLKMAALGIEADSPVSPLQPRLDDGIHLRWNIDPDNGFPWGGFYLFRRPHVHMLQCVRSYLAGLKPGALEGSILSTDLGDFHSDRVLVATGCLVPIGGQVGLDLGGRGFVDFAFCEPACEAQIEIGFPPSSTTDCRLSFTDASVVDGLNPRTDGGVTCLLLTSGGLPAKVSSIVTWSGPGALWTRGLRSTWELEVRLPGASPRVELDISYGASLKLQAFDINGALVCTVQRQGHGQEIFALAGPAIHRILIHGSETLLHALRCDLNTIQVSAYSGNKRVERTLIVRQGTGTSRLSFWRDGITHILLSAGPAVLTDVCLAPQDRAITQGWSSIEGLSYPLRLPLTHPDYPCTRGQSEDLAAARRLASQRIHYGDPQRYTAPTAPKHLAGTVRVANGSAVVIGQGTGWSQSHASLVLQLAGDPTAYTIQQVLGPGRLLLCRPYEGLSRSGAAYTLSDDAFAQMHDVLAQLVAGGPAGGPMALRALPTVTDSPGTVTLRRGSTTVMGIDTQFSAEMEGLLLWVVGADRALPYQIARCKSATELTLARRYEGNDGNGLKVRVGGALFADASGASLSLRQFLLDGICVRSIHPAFAQALGLYFVDTKAEAGKRYDYLLLGDWNEVLGGSAASALAYLARAGTSGLGFCIRSALGRNKAVPLQIEGVPKVYLLPPVNADVTPRGVSGLAWSAPVTADEALPEAMVPVQYHLWRADLGLTLPAQPPPLAAYQLKTAERSIVIRPSKTQPLPQAPWPAAPLHVTERALADGYYSYCISGVDLFGRHSALSMPAEWHEPAGDRMRHRFAVHVVDRLPPSAPSAVTAELLDPADPAVQDSDYYQAWLATLPLEQRAGAVALRVQWSWPEVAGGEAQVREFRVYLHPGRIPPSPDATETSCWLRRIAVLGYKEHVVVAGGRRRYDVLLLSTDTAEGQPLHPTADQPIREAWVAVSAADHQTASADDPKWAGTALGGRYGNQSRVVAPARVFRVLRSLPDKPLLLADSERVFATPADYYGRSYYRLEWQMGKQLRAQVFRALDDGLFKADLKCRPRPPLDPVTDAGLFPVDWPLARRQQIAAVLNALNAPGPPPGDGAAALERYRGLANDALRVLAGLPDMEAAFVLVSAEPIEGPAGGGTCSYTDTLDGRARNRYFYRVALLDQVSNRSPLSLSSPPVWLPDVEWPRTPVLSKILGGDREITLQWTASHEPDLFAYRIYRADRREDADDLRRMVLVRTEPKGSVEWKDAVPGCKTYYYRMVALDGKGNASAPSAPLKARAYDEGKPAPPTWGEGKATPTGMILTWTLADLAQRTLVQRQDPLVYPPRWERITQWLPAGTQQASDSTRVAGRTYVYRLRVQDAQGRLAGTNPQKEI